MFSYQTRINTKNYNGSKKCLIYPLSYLIINYTVAVSQESHIYSLQSKNYLDSMPL